MNTSHSLLLNDAMWTPQVDFKPAPKLIPARPERTGPLVLERTLWVRANGPTMAAQMQSGDY